MAPSIVDGEETAAVAAGDGNLTTVLHPPAEPGNTGSLAERQHSADVVLFDGTLRTDDEMLRQGIPQQDRKLYTTQWR